jgi:regulator of sirC expression with transglutaminase-like and TPR domain
MLVGQRCGLRVEGINFPGHFLARHDGVLFDPFRAGRIIGIPECRQILARQKLELQPSHLETAAPIAIARRILANLLYVYQSDEDIDAAAESPPGSTPWTGNAPGCQAACTAYTALR